MRETLLLPDLGAEAWFFDPGETLSKAVRWLISLLHGEGGSASGPPEEPTEPPARAALAVRVSPLQSAFQPDYSPTYLNQPEPDPNAPPTQPDPQPGLYYIDLDQLTVTVEGGKEPETLSAAALELFFEST